MRFLKRQTLNRRVPNDDRLYVDIANGVVMGTTNSLTMPKGAEGEKPSSPVVGMIRYNTTSNEVEVYQGVGGGTTWRSLRYKESAPIIQQNLGAGDGNTLYFGPLNAAYDPTNVSSDNDNFGGQNILVIVENVIQLFNTNYTVTQSVPDANETYTGVSSALATVGSSTIYFNTSLTATGASGNSTTATLTFDTMDANPFSVGQSITVTGITPVAYNGVFVVTAVTTSSVSYASTATGSLLFSGNIASASAVYTATDLVGAVVSGSASIPAGAEIVSYESDADTDALVSITLDAALITSDISAGTTITITETALAREPGYYLYFSSPVPYGKPVTALIGFDQ
jgi:hypothetical protein